MCLRRRFIYLIPASAGEDTMAKGAWNALVSAVVDPALRKLAERFASSVSEDSWLRSEFAERFLAGLKGLAESYKGTGVSGVVTEKATDFFDFASGDLFGKGGEKKSAADVLQGWMNKFFSDAGKRLEKAANPEAELAKIKQEFAARMEVLRMIEAAAKELAEEKKAAAKPAKPVQPIEVGKTVDQFLRLVWFEATQVVRNIWTHARAPFWIYLFVVVALLGAIIASSMVVIGGVAIESTWVIFWGGIFLLGMIILVGVVLIPAVLGIDVIRAIYNRLTGGTP